MSLTLETLAATIESRKLAAPAESYTARLFEAGAVAIAKKVGEEAIEVVVAAQSESDERLTYEAADLVYHLLVLLAARGVAWSAVEGELARRSK